MDIDDILSWPSLVHELALEIAIFGSSSNRVKNWLDQQLSFLHDQDFARLFSDNIDCFDVEPSAYNHRLLKTHDGSMLGGIRFYGLDVARPFVEVIAHNFANLDALRIHVKEHWQVFSPQFVRLSAPAHELPTSDAVLDVSIHGAPYTKMAPPTADIVLSQDVQLDVLNQMVIARYERVKQDHQQLGRNISAAGLDSLTKCHENDDLYVARLSKGTDPIGMICVRDGAIGWLQGDEVVEEVIVAKASGRGHATKMQTGLAAIRAQKTPEKLLIGTIDKHNHASRKSAERAGRPEIMRRVFLPL